MKVLARSNCHILKLFLGMFGDALTASFPAAGRFYCVLCARDLIIMAFVFGCAVGHLILGVY
jgi:hypothetical protein